MPKIGKPRFAHLFPFDHTLLSTDGIKPLDGSVVTMIEGAVAIEKPTVNLTPNINGRPATMVAAGTTPPQATLLQQNHPFGSEVWKVVFKAGSATGFAGCRVVSSNWAMVRDGRPYAMSVYIKGDTSKLGIYHTGSYGLPLMTAVPELNTDGYICYQKVSSLTGTGTATEYLTIYLASAITTDVEIYVVASQVEESFPTTFTNQSRASGKLSFSAQQLNINNTWWRIRYFGTQPPDTQVDHASSPRLLQVGTYSANNSLSLWWYYGRLRLYVKGSTSSGWSASLTASVDYIYPYLRWETYDIILENKNRIRVFVNGTKVIEVTIPDPFTLISGNVQFLGSDSPSCYANGWYDEFVYSLFVPSEAQLMEWDEPFTENMLCISESTKLATKAIESVFQHTLKFINLSTGANLADKIDLESLSLSAEEQSQDGLSSVNTLSFDIELFPGQDIGNYVSEGNVIEVIDTFNGEELVQFYGTVQPFDATYKNLEHRYSISVYDKLKLGIQKRFSDHVVKVNEYLCNNNDPDHSLMHYLAYQMGFFLDGIRFEDITDSAGTYLIVPYAHFEKDKKILAEMTELAKSVLGKVYINFEGKLVFTSPVNGEDYYDLGTTFSEEIQKEISKRKLKSTYDQVVVSYDQFRIAERQVVWMFFDKSVYDESKDLANMRLEPNTTSAWIRIEYVTPIALNVESVPEILVEDQNGQDMSGFFNYEVEIDMTGGKVRFRNLHATQPIYIQKFKLFGEPLEQFPGNEVKYSEIVNPSKPLSIKNKYIQTRAIAEINAKYNHHIHCKDRWSYKFEVPYAPYAWLSNKAHLLKRDIDTDIIINRVRHKPDGNRLMTTLDVTEYLPANFSLGIISAIEASQNYGDIKDIVNMREDGIFAENTPPPVPTGILLTASFKNVWVEWDTIDRRDLLGFNVYIDDGSGSFKKRFTDASYFSFGAPSNTAVKVRVSSVCIKGESELSAEHTTTTAGGVDWDEVLNVAVNSPDIVDLAVTNLKVAYAAIATANMQDLSVTNAKLGNLAVDSAKIAQLAVENGHIKDLNGDKLWFRSVGGQHVRAEEISTELIKVGHPIMVQSGDFYLPFDASAFGSKAEKPVEAVVSLLKDGLYGGCVAVERATTNLLSNPTFPGTVGGMPTGWIKYFATGEPKIVDEHYYADWNVVEMNNPDGATNVAIMSSTTTRIPVSNQTYVFAIDAKTENGTQRFLLGYRAYDASGTSIGTSYPANIYGIYPGIQWKRYYGTENPVAKYPTCTSIALVVIGSYTTAGITWVTRPQVEASSYPTAAVDGIRAAGVLSYNKKIGPQGFFVFSFQVTPGIKASSVNYLVASSDYSMYVYASPTAIYINIPHSGVNKFLASASIASASTWDWLFIGLAWSNLGEANVVIGNKTTGEIYYLNNIPHTYNCITNSDKVLFGKRLTMPSYTTSARFDDFLMRDEFIMLDDLERMFYSTTPYVDPEQAIPGDDDGFLIYKGTFAGFHNYEETFRVTSKGEIWDRYGYPMLDINGVNGKIIAQGIYGTNYTEQSKTYSVNKTVKVPGTKRWICRVQPLDRMMADGSGSHGDIKRIDWDIQGTFWTDTDTPYVTLGPGEYRIDRFHVSCSIYVLYQDNYPAIALPSAVLWQIIEIPDVTVITSDLPGAPY